MQNLLDELKTLLATQPRFTQEGRMIKQAVIDAAQSLDADLLRLLMSHDALKRHFFQDVDGMMVFDKVKLLRFVSNKAFLEDSYTAFKNKIGLATKNADGTYDAYLSDSKEVVLAYPYKDCMLEGGQTKEDQKRNEIFWNETLAPDDIDRLTAPKAFSKVRRYTADGVQENVTDLSLQDNYIIKGNNLLALYSLLPVYRGKVKLIYIDPPYNRGGNADTFSYNNNFKRSTWVTFMKNRLEVAKKLLAPLGAMVIAIDEAEQCYLGVLIDEMFPEFESHCITIIHNPGGNQGTNFSYCHEYAFFIIPKGIKSIGLQNREDNPDIRPLRDVSTGNHLRTDAKNCFYPILVKNNKVIGFGEVCPDDFHPESANIIKPDGVIEVYPIDAQGNERKWVFARQTVESIFEELTVEFNQKRKVFDIIRRKTKFNYKTVWMDKRYDANQNGSKLLKKLVPDDKFSFPKSLYTVKDCVSAIVGEDKNAIVLDYHAGSGTTAHAVLEINHADGGNRKFILCEQLDYVESVTNKRVIKVIENQGGGSFVYLELANANQHFVDKIQAAESEAELLALWQQMQAEAFISYKVTPDMIDKNAADWAVLSMDDKKRFLIEALDKNLLYVPHCDMESKEFGMSEADKAATQAFYNLKNTEI